MALFFEEEGSLRLPLPCEELAREVVDAALNYVGCPYEAQVNLLLTTDEQIHEMNRQFRGIDRESLIFHHQTNIRRTDRCTGKKRCHNIKRP